MNTEPKIYEYKTLTYKGKTIFGKVVMGEFRRIRKYFQEDEACFMFIEDGDFILRTPQQVIHFQTGDGMFAKCGNYFFEDRKGHECYNNKTILIAVYFYPEIISSLFKDDSALANYMSDYDVNKVIIDKFLVNFKENISFLLDHPEMVDDTLLLTKLKELIILLAKTEKAPHVVDFIAEMFRPIEYDFVSIVEKNLYSNLSLSELAMLCGMSLASFKRYFSKYYSCSPRIYIQQHKIEKAKQLLKIKENRISEIAFKCGFNTIATFNKNFKSHTGTSPSIFRITS